MNNENPLDELLDSKSLETVKFDREQLIAFRDRAEERGAARERAKWTAEKAEALHPDDAAVDRFAAAMKATMAKSRKKGRSGWDDPARCTIGELQALLAGHVEKGDPVDVGNLAMMLFNRDAPTLHPMKCKPWVDAAVAALNARPTAADSAALCPCGFDSASCKHYNKEGDCTHDPDAPDHGETVLRVQELLGITRTGWVDRSVIELRIKKLQFDEKMRDPVQQWKAEQADRAAGVMAAALPEREVAEDPLTGEMEVMPSSLGGLHAELLQKGDRVSLDAAAQIRGLRRQLFDYEVHMDELKALQHKQPAMGPAGLPLDKAAEKQQFIEWGQTFHRNARTYTARDFDHGLAAWYARAARVVRPTASGAACLSCAAKQAKIDALMFEYCPNDITPEQLANWEAHQRRAATGEKGGAA